MHERITFRIPTQRLEELDDLVEDGTYPNRSEAIRNAVQLITESHEKTECNNSDPTHTERVRASSDD